MELADKQTFGLVTARIPLPPNEATSSAARSLARLQIGCGGRNLCAGRESGGDFDALELPLIVAGCQSSVPVAARWALCAALALLNPR